MVKLAINVSRILDVLASFDQIKVFRSASSTGPFVEVTGVGTRLVMYPEVTSYWYEDATGDGTQWYTVAYYNSGSDTTSSQSVPSLSSVAGPVGYTFNNYEPEPGEWGDVLTPDDIRYTYLFGIDTSATDASKGALTDEQLRYLIEQGLADFEKFLNIDIRRRKYVTEPASTLKRSHVWREGVDYTDEDDKYAFDPAMWTQFGFLQLRHYPLIQINRAVMLTVVGGQILDLKNMSWLRLFKRSGQVNMYPVQGQMSYGPFAVAGNMWRLNIGTQYPQGFAFDYETGFESSAFLPKDLRGVIGKWVTIQVLNILGDAHLPGVASSSISLDGLSESRSTTKSAQAGMYGARVKQYLDDIQDWLVKNKFKYAIPMSFVGAL